MLLISLGSVYYSMLYSYEGWGRALVSRRMAQPFSGHFFAADMTWTTMIPGSLFYGVSPVLIEYCDGNIISEYQIFW